MGVDILARAMASGRRQGGAGEVLVVANTSGQPLSATWQEIYDAPFAVLVEESTNSKSFTNIDSVYYDSGTGKYIVSASSTTYTADTPNDYPV